MPTLVADDSEQSCASDAESTDSEADRRAFGIYQTLPLVGAGSEEPGSPDSAAEYLSRVRLEAAQLPDVVTAARGLAEPKVVSHDEPAAATDSELDEIAQAFARVDKRWMRAFLADFAAVRDMVLSVEQVDASAPESLPEPNNPKAWRTFCLGLSGAGEDSEDGEMASARPSPPHLPSLSFILGLNQDFAVQLLRWHVDWLVGRDKIAHHRATWIYSLACCINPYLRADNAASLRQLLRQCATLRLKAALSADAAQLDILMAICGSYFRQDEDWSSVRVSKPEASFTGPDL